MNHLISTWALTYLAHSTLLILTVLAVSRWTRSAHVRDLLWKLALAGGVVTASLQAALPSAITVPMPLVTERTSLVAAPVEQVVSPSARIDGTITSTPPPSASTTDLPRPAHWRTPASWVGAALPILWSLGTIVLLSRLLLGHAKLLRELQNRTELADGEDFHLLQRLLRSAPVRREIRLSASDVTHSPIAMLGDEIVVPGAIFSNLTRKQRESILAHEIAHIERRDPVWLTVGEVLCAVLFFQPLNRLASRHLKETAEYICDDAAITRTGDRGAVAETLGLLAATLSPAWSVRVAAMAEGGSGLIRRVTRVLREDPAPDQPLKRSYRLAIVLAPITLLAALTPGISPAAAPVPLEPAMNDVAQVPGEITWAIAPRAERETAVAIAAAAAAGNSSMESAETVGSTARSSGGSSTTVYVTGSRVGKTELTFNRFTDGVLTQSFEGPEGQTTVTMRAHAAEVAHDGSWVRFFEDDGYLRVRQEASRGPVREVEVVPGTTAEPRYIYRVDGVDTPWCRDAERVIEASVRGRKAYAESTARSTAGGGSRAAGSSGASGTSRVNRTRAPASALSESPVATWSTHLKWTARHQNETGSGAARHYVRLVARGVHYNPETGEVFIEPDGRLEIEERTGRRTRTFIRTADEVRWSGEWEGETQDAPRQWVRRILRENSSLVPRVIETISAP